MLLSLPAWLLVAGCHRDMRDNGRYKPYEASAFFENNSTSREPVANTVARGRLETDSLRYTGKSGGRPATQFPYPVTAEMMRRGRERYDIYCTPCHDRLGTGHGIIVQRGFRQPPSFHIERLRTAPPGYYFDVITSGFGAMYDYAAQVKPDDRWAIAAYIRALQLSQNATLAEVPADRRGDLDRSSPALEQMLRPSRGGGLNSPAEGGTGFSDDPHDPEQRGGSEGHAPAGGHGSPQPDQRRGTGTGTGGGH